MNNIPYTKEQLMKANARLMEKNKRYREALEESNEKLMNLYNDMSDHRIDMDEATKRLEYVGMNILRKTLEGSRGYN